MSARRKGGAGITFWDFYAAVGRYKAGTHARKATLACLASFAGDHGGAWSCWPSQATIAETTEQSVRTVRRHLDELRSQGIISDRESLSDGSVGRPPKGYAFNMALLGLADEVAANGGADYGSAAADYGSAPLEITGTDAESFALSPVANGRERGTQKQNAERKAPTPLFPAEPEAPAAKGKEPRANQEAAREIAKAVFEAKNPRPATPFPGVCQIIEALLNVGHAPERVQAACMAVPTISTGWLEGQLNARPKPTGPKVYDGSAWAGKPAGVTEIKGERWD